MIDLADFSLADVNIDVSSGSTAYVNISGTLNVSASGASNLPYAGDHSLWSIDTSGDSSVEVK